MLISIPLLAIWLNLFLICELLVLNVGVYIWLWYWGVNSCWIIPILLYYAKRQRNYVNSLLSQNKFSANWVQSKAIDEYVSLISAQKNKPKKQRKWVKE